MDFEWDAEKSKKNLGKHGIDFESAAKLWEDEDLVILPSTYPDEDRYLAVGRIGNTIWTAVFSERLGATRLISVRRSRHDERTIYEENQSRKP